MKLIVPLAGRGSRMQPHSLHRPKSLLRLAGATVLDHVLASLDGLAFESIVFIVGPDGAPIREWARVSLETPYAFVEQPEPEGQAQAVALAREHLQGETLIVFADTIFEIDTEAMRDAIRSGSRPDGLLFLQEVEDPSALGVAQVDENGRVLRLIEKPSEAISNLAVMGLYYLRDGARLLAAIDGLLAAERRTRGEFYLADALQDMIEAGAHFQCLSVEAWWECGTILDSIAAHRFLLEGLADETRLESTAPRAWGADSRIIPPVHLEEDVRIENSVVGPHVYLESGCIVTDSHVGPHVSLGRGSRVTRATVHDTIGAYNSSIEDADIEASMLGVGAGVTGVVGRVNLGDASRVRSARPDTSPDAASST